MTTNFNIRRSIYLQHIGDVDSDGLKKEGIWRCVCIPPFGDIRVAGVDQFSNVLQRSECVNIVTERFVKSSLFVLKEIRAK